MAERINRRQAIGAIVGGAVGIFTGKEVGTATSDTDGALRIVAAETLANFRMFVDAHRQLISALGKEPPPLEAYRDPYIYATGQILSGVDPLSPNFWEVQGGSDPQPNATPNPTPGRTQFPGKTPTAG